MNNFELYAIWDQFLKTWPSSRQKKMTLEEYARLELDCGPLQ